jgi:hypothetical protein
MDGRIVAAAPPLAALVATIGFIVAEAAGVPVLGPGRVRNVAEAAGLGSASEVVRLLDGGAEAATVLPIRPDVISASVQRASALEAAVWSRRVELVELLDQRGAIPPSERPRLACLATDLGVADVAEYLASGAAPVCTPNAVMEAIQARTSGAERR